MKKRPIQHQLNGLMALLLFGVFAACVLAVLLTGANAYRRLTQRDQEAYLRRTCVQYLATRVRQADSRDRVSVESFGGADALVLTETDGSYTTRIYCYDGWLMELYAAADADMEPQDGEKVLELSSLHLTLEDGALTADTVDTAGASGTLRMTLRSGEGAAA